MAKPDEALDFAIALSLEEQFDRETKKEQKTIYNLPKESHGSKYDSMDPRSVVDQHWEFTDPNPNIHDLFVQFDSMFFWCTLLNKGVAVRWSKRMTLCAGTCSYEGRGGLCSIQLSEPLMKLRPRKDLVETLLHEMIHAYLFVTDNNKDHDGHGPNFLSHMNRINKLTGANISVYHSFHDEVREYRQHWWKCNGPCQHQPPFFGLLMRAMNRAPSSRDPWWAKHQRTCGGTYVKIKEPDSYKKKGVKEKDKMTVKSKNIKDILTRSSSKAGKTKEEEQKNSRSDVTPLQGQGHSLTQPKDVSNSKGRNSVVPGRTVTKPSGNVNLREKMLIAAEKRRSENEHRGVKTVGKKRSRPSSPIAGPSNRDTRQFTDQNPSHSSAFKRTKVGGPDDILVLDSPPVLKVPPSLQHSKRTPLETNSSSTDAVCIDLSSDNEGESSISSNNTATTTVSRPREVITLNDDSSEETLLSELTEFKTCPVCGMANIPAVIINTHVSFCLDAEEESLMVDDDTL